MLGLDVEVDVKFKESHTPVYFIGKNECVSCGKKGTLIFVDIFGRETGNKEINSFDHIKCKACGRGYSIRWSKAEDGNGMIPSASSYNIMRDFDNLIHDRSATNVELKTE